ncbi:sugar-transporter integral membrane protein [Actinocatenispora thailandica]|uniref:Sugar-transporter integral membrane protein n=1 Tax=Actinocatenispora thailandica TaxID=227318 RepID=A0A7R7DMK9_9ACTN|nr:sugar ABC transporter permease [Actinocatenispora thailandica]BCJ34331.1 sugar-transporter integral membrane protein [Actinocatenispora thailandica]
MVELAELIRRRAAAGERAGRGSTRLRETAVSLGMAGPAVALYTVMTVVPVGVAVYLSLTNWNGFSDALFVGLANYRHLFADPDSTHAWYVTAAIAVVGTIGMVGGGLAYALLLKGRSRSNSFFRALAYYPHVISALILGYLWAAILGTNGAVNSTLAKLGIGPVGFLFDEHLALVSLIWVIVWAGFGFNVVLFVAALQTVPAELLEAAAIDGASRWQTNRRVVVPMIAPVVTVATVLNLVGLIRAYDLIVSLTGGGPAGSTQTYSYLILARSFAGTKVGYATAQAVFLMVVSAALALLVTALRNRQDQAAAG